MSLEHEHAHDKEERANLLCQLEELLRRLPDEALGQHAVSVARELGERLRRRTAERDHLGEVDEDE